MVHNPTFGEDLSQTAPAVHADSMRRARPAISMMFDSRLCVAILVALAASLAIFGAFANIVIYQIAETPEATIARVMQRLDLGHEPSLPAYFSSLVLLLNGAMLMLIGRGKQLSASPFVLHWFALGFIFMALVPTCFSEPNLISTSACDATNSSGQIAV